jgi:drug/metabolite transporter (DMT)-like permease
MLVVLWRALAIFVLGLILLIRRQLGGHSLDTIGFIVAVAGLLYLGTGATFASQMLLSINRSHVDTFVIFTLVFTILPIILGLLAIRIAVRNIGYWTFRSRFYLILLGVGAFATLAGFLIGPILAISAAFIPSKTHEKHRMKHVDDA